MRRGPRTLHFSFTDGSLTHFGGLVLFQRFCRGLDLRHRLQRQLRLPHRRGDYAPADLVLALLFAVIAGLRRINKTEILQYNGTFLSLLGLEQFPDQSSLRRFLRRLTPDTIRQLARLHDQLRRVLFAAPHSPSGLVFDIDAVVLTLYGEQQGARVGYNPRKKGRRSYHPLLCFEAGRQEFWHGSLRPGDAAANTGVIHLLRRVLAKVPPTIARCRIRVRADAGYFSGKFIRGLETEALGYVVVAREYRGIKARAQVARFQKLRHGWEVGEFQYAPTGWKTPHRFVVVRRPKPTDPEEARQLTLFADRRWSYTVLVTNLPLTPWRVWRFYCPRATIEKNIRELLYDLPLGKIPSAQWLPNVAFFQLVLFAYDLAHWFKRLCLPPEYLHATLETLRTDLLVVPARLVRTGGRNVLQLPRNYHHRDLFVAAYRAASKLRLPRKN